MNSLGEIGLFLVIQLLLGKRGSFPYGVLIGFDLPKIMLLVIVSDLVQTLFLLNSFEYLSKRVSWIHRRNIISSRKKRDKIHKSWIQKIKNLGGPGLIVLAALPYGGGALTGSFVAQTIKIEKKQAFLYIFLGCVLGAIIFCLGFSGLVIIFE